MTLRHELKATTRASNTTSGQMFLRSVTRSLIVVRAAWWRALSLGSWRSRQRYRNNPSVVSAQPCLDLTGACGQGNKKIGQRAEMSSIQNQQNVVHRKCRVSLHLALVPQQPSQLKVDVLPRCKAPASGRPQLGCPLSWPVLTPHALNRSNGAEGTTNPRLRCLVNCVQ
jgi:hypothetical protein